MKSENTYLAKRCNRYLRYYLVEAANSVRSYDLDHKIYLQKKYNETSKHKRAIVLSARKLVRLVDVLLRNHQLYTPPEVGAEIKDEQNNLFRLVGCILISLDTKEAHNKISNCHVLLNKLNI